MQTHYPSLLVVLNSQKALWFSVKEDGVELVEELGEKKERYTDHEAHFSASGTGATGQSGAADVDNKRDAESLSKHIKHVAEKTQVLWQENRFAHLSVIAPEQYKNDVASEIHKSIPNQQIDMVFGNHVHASKKEVKALFLRSIRPQ